MISLDTGRLQLRQPTLDDLADLHALTEPKAVRRYLGPDPPSLTASYDRLMRTAGGWALCGYSNFTVIERETGDYVGSCGLFQRPRDLGPDFDPFPEAGWIIAASRWGRGYAAEAMSAVLAWFEASHGPGRTVCMISPGNAASERLAARLGYAPIGLATYMGDEIMRYARDPGAQ